MTLGDLISITKLWLRATLRRWLGVENDYAKLLPLFEDLEQKIKLRVTSEVFDEAIQNLQDQISANAQKLPYVTPVDVQAEEDFQVMSGHVPFSQRKRNYEIRMQKPKETPAGKQIEENARLIASATRKTDKS